MKKLLLPVSIVIAALIGCGIYVAYPGFATTKAEPAPEVIIKTVEVPAKELDADKLWKLVNDWRISQGLPTYQKSGVLCDFAAIRINEIRNDWSHDQAKATTDNYGFHNWFYKLGENLAKDYSSEEATLQGWLSSPGHLENLKETYTHSCIVTHGNFAVQTFGK